jgi:hypothetical protein
VFAMILIFTLHKICIKQNLKIGNFERNYKEVAFFKIEEIPLPFEANNFTGISPKFIFINPKKLDEINRYNRSSKTFLSKKISHKNHNFNVLGDSLFSFDPNLRKVFIYDTNTMELLQKLNLNVGFDRAIAVDNKTILLRSATERYTKNIFSVFSIPEQINRKLGIQLADTLEIDGGLKTDGYFANKDSILIFTQYKKGNFYTINNKLTQIKRFRTIDKIQEVDGVKLSVDSTFYFEKPVLNVNLLTSISGERVYIISFVKSKSDRLNEFTKSRLLDIYNYKTGEYINSYYLPNDGIEKALDFYIDKNKIYLLFNKKIVIYEIK